ncbi:MAG: Rid family detoxifying hydrolase [Pseudomonadota bacterium]
MKICIDSKQAPKAIGAYSHAIRTAETIYLSGQIGLDPETMQMEEGIDAQIRRIFLNLQAVAEAAGTGLNDAVKLTVYLTDLAHFPRVNELMALFFQQPYPARTTIGVTALPRNALVEIDAVLAAA